MNKAYLGMIILALTCIQLGGLTPNQVSAQQPAALAVGGGNDNQRVISQLQGILQDEARFGKTPRNNQLLQQIQTVINRFQPGRNPQPVPPQNNQVGVEIFNQGPGGLEVTDKQGVRLGFLDAGQSSSFLVPSDRLSLIADTQATTIMMKLGTGKSIQFWDKDDQQWFKITKQFSQPFTLANGERGYQIFGK